MYKINKIQHGKRFVRDFHEVISILDMLKLVTSSKIPVDTNKVVDIITH